MLNPDYCKAPAVSIIRPVIVIFTFGTYRTHALRYFAATIDRYDRYVIHNVGNPGQFERATRRDENYRVAPPLHRPRQPPSGYG